MNRVDADVRDRGWLVAPDGYEFRFPGVPGAETAVELHADTTVHLVPTARAQAADVAAAALELRRAVRDETALIKGAVELITAGKDWPREERAAAGRRHDEAEKRLDCALDAYEAAVGDRP